ncbi:small ribosomal subunit protein uS15m [Periplaneta americana]|uniref:small ribosomal subunit protein uS15m n=1 Tax=Periplaneta americana TaxID=6978 RepID=UPI0037E86C99
MFSNSFNGCYLICTRPIIYQAVRSFKSDLKIKWVRPPKIPCIKPEKSGDLTQFPSVDIKQLPLEFQNSEELKTADELVKRVFSLEFSRKKKCAELVRNDVINSVKQHEFDTSSEESRIASMTAKIRYLQHVMEEFPRDKRCKVRLKELIDRRKKRLKFLRKWDYKRFEWLLEKLDLVYKPPPSHFHWITRKDSLRKLTDKHCEDLKQERIAAYRASLEAQQVDFLREKLEKLRWIQKEEQECGVDLTVSDSDIDQVVQQLKELELSQQEKMKKSTAK